MRVVRTDSFKLDYQRLPVTLQRRFDQKLEFFMVNVSHPSLRVKKMEGAWGERGVWEAAFTKGYRFTFTMEGDLCILRRVGAHDILRKP